MTEIGPSAAAELAPELIQFLVELNNALHKGGFICFDNTYLKLSDQQGTRALQTVVTHLRSNCHDCRQVPLTFPFMAMRRSGRSISS